MEHTTRDIAFVDIDDPTFVPADDRVWGLDRRTFLWAGPVIVLFLLMVIVLPGIEGTVDRGDVTTEGEMLVLAGAEELTMEAAGGWELDGFRKGQELTVKVPSTTTLSKDGVRFETEVANFSGTASDLIDRVEDLNDRQGDPMGLGAVSQRIDDTVDDGNPAVVKVYTGLDRKGIVIAFVVTLDGGDQLGVEATAFGSADDMAAQLATILKMVDSITVNSPATTTTTDGEGS